MSIKINDRFEIERYSYGWMLHEWQDSTDKDGNPIRTKRTTYPSRLYLTCKTIIDACGQDAQSAAEIVVVIEQATKDILAVIEGGKLR